MTRAFQFSCRTPLVWFGAGRALSVRSRLDQLGVRRAMVACTASGERRYSAVIDALGDACAAVFSEAQPHCPINVASAALARFKEARCDTVVTIGGGSSIGLGKYIAVETGAHHIALPTTLSGSEMTPLFGILVDGEKRSRREPKALADTVIVDPSLALSLPLKETATTGMNALAHCIEALYVPAHNPVTDALALQGIEALFSALQRLAVKPDDLPAREQAAFGAMLGGLLVSSVGIGMHHRICHVLGGRFGAPHGETNGVVLPHVLAFNAPAIPEAMPALIRLMGSSPATALHELAAALGAPLSLRALGIEANALPEIAEEALHHIDHNPRPVDRESVARLLTQAWHGEPPTGNFS